MAAWCFGIRGSRKTSRTSGTATLPRGGLVYNFRQEVEGTSPLLHLAKTGEVLPQRPAWSYRKDRPGLTAKTDLVLPQRPVWSYRKDQYGLRRKICQMPETRNRLHCVRFVGGSGKRFSHLRRCLGFAPARLTGKQLSRRRGSMQPSPDVSVFRHLVFL